MLGTMKKNGLFFIKGTYNLVLMLKERKVEILVEVPMGRGSYGMSFEGPMSLRKLDFLHGVQRPIARRYKLLE